MPRLSDGYCLSASCIPSAAVAAFRNSLHHSLQVGRCTYQPAFSHMKASLFHCVHEAQCMEATAPVLVGGSQGGGGAPVQGAALLGPEVGHEVDELAAGVPAVLQHARLHLQLVPAPDAACRSQRTLLRCAERA